MDGRTPVGALRAAVSGRHRRAAAAGRTHPAVPERHARAGHRGAVRPDAAVPVQGARRRPGALLQVHPTRTQAAAGYAAEEARGVPLDAPERVFKDPGHKPELICALGDFEALCGFRPAPGTARLLDALAVPLLAPWADDLRAHPAAEALPALLRRVLAEDRPTRTQLGDVTRALHRLAAEGGPFAEACAGYARATAQYPGDPGLIAALLLNHVRLTAGQALYLDAGVPHAYLRGVGVELMANSDNVLRCGLTPKHVDVDGLLAVTSFRADEPQVLTALPGDRFEDEFPSPPRSSGSPGCAPARPPSAPSCPPRRSCCASRAAPDCTPPASRTSTSPGARPSTCGRAPDRSS